VLKVKRRKSSNGHTLIDVCNGRTEFTAYSSAAIDAAMTDREIIELLKRGAFVMVDRKDRKDGKDGNRTKSYH
jgi:hypothetical protein